VNAASAALSERERNGAQQKVDARALRPITL
jgi:hypothetical protein